MVEHQLVWIGTFTLLKGALQALLNRKVLKLVGNLFILHVGKNY